MPQIVVFEVPRDPGGVNMGPRRPLGPILEPLQLLEGSWSALGGLLAALGGLLDQKKVLLIGSWPAK